MEERDKERARERERERERGAATLAAFLFALFWVVVLLFKYLRRLEHLHAPQA